MPRKRRTDALIVLQVAQVVPWAAIGVLVAVMSWDDASSWQGTLFQWIARHVILFGCLALVDGVGSALLYARISKNDRIGEWTVARLILWGILGAIIPLTVFSVWCFVVGVPKVASLPLVLTAMALGSAGSACTSVVALAHAQRALRESGSDAPELPIP